jgi:hypothetical protein
VSARVERLRAINRLLSKYEPDLARGFMEGVKRIQSEVVLKDVAEKIAAGDIAAVMAIIGPVQIGTSFGAMLNTTLGAYFDSGDMAARDTSVSVWFNHANPTAAASWQRYQQAKITQLTDEAKETINQIMRRALAEGRNPMDTARTIRDSIGLTAQQEQAVDNYRTALQQRMSNALERKLRDRRFDSTVRRAIANDKALSPEQIDRFVARYQARQLQHRAQTIARTESTRAINAGQQAYIETAVKDGVVRREQVRRFWVVTRDERTRRAHAAIPRLNPDGVGLDEPFKTPLGPLMYPGDTAGSPENVINCRCALFTRIVPTGE